MDIMEQEFKNGCSPDKMLFCSFTKKAVDEAISRATNRFNFTKKDMLYFKTIHSLAFHSMGLKRTQVIGKDDLAKIGKHLGLTFSNSYDSELFPGQQKGDRYLFMSGFSRARHIPPKKVWDMINRDNLNWWEYLRFEDTLAAYKHKYSKLDFSDMLSQARTNIKVDVVIIDEAQDLSTAQWYFLEQIIAHAKKVYIGGDDDQAIFTWSGADVNKFLNLQGQREILHQSHRIPKAAHKLASDITSKIKHRVEKPYKSKDVTGSIEYWNSIDQLQFESGSWLLLARNSYLLNELVQSTRQKGVSYSVRGKHSFGADHVKAIQQWESWRKGKKLDDADKTLITQYLPIGIKEWPKDKIWHEAFTRMPLEEREYYISLLRRGESLTHTPRVNISTIHGIKGGEADNVVLITDMANSTWEASKLDQDSEHRVWYVGATRCKKSLHIIMPRGRYFYTL